jgi:hypothetical protein
MKTKMRSLMVVKPHKYGTRHLTAGEEYEAPERHAFALLASKKVKFVEKAAKGIVPAKIEETMTPIDELAVEWNEIDRLRAQANRLGIEVDGRWGTIRLQHEIAKARK